MNDLQSTQFKALRIGFDLQAESCTLDPDEIECAPTSEQRKKMNETYVAIL